MCPFKSNSHWDIEESFDFTLNHFQEPIFPRKIMTKDLGYQIEVSNKQEALGYYKNSKYEDCRINAYPSFTQYEGIYVFPKLGLITKLTNPPTNYFIMAGVIILIVVYYTKTGKKEGPTQT